LNAFLDRYFGIQKSESTVRREILGGLTTFATMSYIVFVQPTVLSAAGMDFGSVLMATCLSAAFASILMGLYARIPVALAPGMGENFLFAFTVCSTFPGGMGFSWQAGLAIVFLSGVLFIALSLTPFRERVMEVLPACLRFSIGPAIGLFIAFVGLQWGGIIVSSPATMVKLGSLHTGPALLTIFGVLFIATMQARRIPGAILLGILLVSIAGTLTGVIPMPTDRVQLSFSTFFHLDFGELITKWQSASIAIALFFFLVLFDTVGTLVGLGTKAGLITDEGKFEKAGKAFMSDAVATTVGATFGTSTVTSYIESASGISAGARTGLAPVVTGLCFIAAIALAPIIHVAGQDIGPAFYNVSATAPHVAMFPVVAPALIVVGFMMMAPLQKVQWDDVTESLPAFATMSMMVFGFGITEGVAMGCISFALIKLLAGRGKEVHLIMYAIAAALIARYVFLL
jgi:AGZA family xanthine/uracil permease-like MFS transporter